MLHLTATASIKDNTMIKLPVKQGTPIGVIEFPEFKIVDSMYYLLLFFPPTKETNGGMRFRIIQIDLVTPEPIENLIMCFGNAHSALAYYFQILDDVSRGVVLPVPGRALSLLKEYEGDITKAFTQYNEELEALQNESNQPLQ